MTDERIEADLAAYVDGELAPSEAGEIEAMLAGNPRYARMVQEMQQAKSWLTSLPAVAVPPGAADLADPTIARLEREGLLDEQEPDGYRRFLTPNILGLAASLVVVATLAVTAYIMLSPNETVRLAGEAKPPSQIRIGDEIRQAPTPWLDDPTDAPAQTPRDPVEPAARPSERPLPTDPDGMASAVVVDEPPVVEPEVSLPYVNGEAVLIVAEADAAEEAAGRVAAAMARSQVAFATRAATLDKLQPNVGEMLWDRLERADVAPDGAAVAFAFVAADGVKRRDVTALVAAATGTSSKAVALWDQAAERQEGSAMVLEGGPGGGPGEFRGFGIPQPAEEPADDAARRVFPNDGLMLYLRRTYPDRELPQDLPAEVAEQLAGAAAQLAITVDADGFADLSPLGLGRIDALGMTTRELAGLVELEVAREFLVAIDGSVVTSRKSEVPGGRSTPVLDLLRVDRNPFTIGDAVRIAFDDGRRTEAVVAQDGLVDLGELGRVEADQKTAGQLQRDLFGQVDADADEVPPAVMNVSSRRAAEKDDTADEAVPVFVLILEAPAAPATRATTQPVTQPATQPSTRPVAW